MSYIKREPLLATVKEIQGNHFGAPLIVRAIESAPSADVVEVVRCKNCKFWGIPHANDIEKSHYCCRDNMWCMPLRFADDYCSYGERSENGT